MLFRVKDVLGEADMNFIFTKIFDFFISEEIFLLGTPQYKRRILDEYLRDYPSGSHNYVIDKEKIIKVLMEKLNDFAEMLRLYLLCFVDKTTEKLVAENKIYQNQVFEYSDVIVTFNYTKTYEMLNPNSEIFHIHGKTIDKIVLGVNSDKSDDIEKMETSFVQFKKYYQRALYDTDKEYFSWLKEYTNEHNENIHLLIMGHSLDITDEDYIRDLIRLSSEVTILYHNEEAKANLIKNLINIFGKKEFVQIRKEQCLEFLPLNMDFSEFSKKRQYNAIDYFEIPYDPITT